MASGKWPKLVISVVALPGWLTLSSAAPADGAATPQPTCVKDASQLRKSDLVSALSTAIAGSQCSSVLRVLAELQNGKRSGGRKLNDKPLDVAAAQKELVAARADTQFTARLNAALSGVSDPNARKVVEAAVLDDLGYFGARELLVGELFQTSGAK
jgi:hypothetical protein